MKQVSLIILIFILLMSFLFVIVFSNLVYAFSVGEPSHDIQKNYGSGDFLKGWINISLENEDSSSEFELNGNVISLIELLNLNFLDNTDYNCTPEDCEKDYSGSAGVVSKTKNINQQGVLVGLKLQGKITGINSFKFDVSSNAGKSCLVPLEISFLETSWSFNNYSADFTCVQARGKCFSSSTEEINVDTKLRCEKINLEKKSAYQIGAWIRKQNNANLTAGLYDLSLEKVEDCKLPDALVAGGEVGCKINEVEAGEYYVCISANTNSNYTMKYEQEDEKCGFYDAEQFTGEYVIDYDVFAKAAAYSEPGTFTFDNSKLGEDTSLEELLFNYISDRYNGNCEAGCFIPVKIKGVPQQIIISNALLDYNTNIMSNKKASNIYDLTEQDFKINSDFLKLILDNAELSVPNEYGDYDITLNLNGEEVFTENINVSEIGKISYIYPVYVAAAVPTVFYAAVSGNKNIVKYTWDFGTGKINTSENFVEYTYSNIGNRSLSLSIEDAEGKITSEIFSIEVSSPKNVINQTFEEYRPNIENLKSKIAILPAWYKLLVEKESEADNLDSQLRNLEGKYSLASTPQDYIDIMNKLNNISVPKEMKTKTGNFAKLSEANNIDVDILVELGAGEGDAGYEQAVAEWSNSQDINLGYETIYLDYGEKKKNIVSVFNLKIKTNEDLGEGFLVIGADLSSAKWKDSYNEKIVSEKTGIVLDDLQANSEKTIEFAIAYIDPEELEVYLSPKLSELEAGVIAPCNFNKICEEEEDYKNCASDCKPWGWVIFWIVLLIAAAFVAYLVMKQWYKLNYERKLFKNRNDLFNLTSFINNARAKGLGNSEIKSQLKKLGWNGEQISYALSRTIR